MRIANVAGRATIIAGVPERWSADAVVSGYDIHGASEGRLPHDPQRLLEVWDDFQTWAASWTPTGAPEVTSTGGELGPPAPRPPQVLAIGLNYAAHAAESSLDVPSSPPTFTKFQSCLAGPFTTVELPTQTVDWEVEIVAVIGREARNVSVEDAWAHVAGLAVGQDLSERTLQLLPPAPQFSLGKSFPGFGPFGPTLVTLDEFDDIDDFALSTAIDGDVVQDGRTSQMIFSIPQLVSRLSQIMTLFAGDVIFTGTPAGVGMGRTPPRFLQPGQELVTTADVIGSLRTVFVAPSVTTNGTGATS